jgi:hypothetical protein
VLNALKKLFHLVRLVAFLSKIEELLIVRRFLEHISENRQEELVDWFEQVLKVDWLKTAHQISGICVLIHVENVKFLADDSSNLLDRCCLACTSLAHK